MRCRWQVGNPPAPLVARLAGDLGCSAVLAAALIRRGFDTAEAAGPFLSPRLQNLGDPFDLPDMDRAVARLHQAREREEPVVLFGDYDVDGVSATAILCEVLGKLGWRVGHYLPGRFSEGYGLSAEAVKNCLAQQATKLLVAIDCGSSSAQVVAELVGAGVDVVVLDHHQLVDPAPAATALVNPRRLADQDHPAAHLCSAGLAFKLAHALVKEGRRRGWGAEMALDVRDWLDLAALGTVADLVPLRGENRILVSTGLQRMARRERVGLAALLEVAGVSGEPGVFELGFQLGPRLNAAGRLETAQGALDLLLARDPRRAMELARQLDVCNRERQAIEAAVAEQALERVRARFDPARDLVIVEGDPSWHIGVVGIVASRVMRECNRPVLVLGGDGTTWRGSGRSIDGFDLAAALRECSELLLRHGGHAMAVGVSAPGGSLDGLRERLNEVARRTMQSVQLKPLIQLDAELPLAQVTLPLLEELRQLEPLGQGNPPVQVVCRGLRCLNPARRMGQDGRHMRFSVAQDGGRADVVWWGANGAEAPSGVFDLAAQPQINEFQGRRTVQLRLLDWSPAGQTGTPC